MCITIKINFRVLTSWYRNVLGMEFEGIVEHFLEVMVEG